MTATTFIGHFLGPDTHSNRPSASGLPNGTLYVCTTHGKLERVVSGAWADYATLGGPAAMAVNLQTASYTLALTDLGSAVSIANASANTLTVPTNASVAFPVGTWVLVRQGGAGQTVVAGASGVTVNSRGNLLALNGQYAWARLVKVATDTWDISGDLTTAPVTLTIGSVNPAGASNGTNTGIPSGTIWMCKRTLAGAAAGAKWTALRAYITGGTSTGTKVRLGIYDDLSNSPNNLLGSGEVTVAVSAAAAVYTYALPGTANAANGAYWVGFQFDTVGTMSPAPWYATSGGTQAYGPSTYASGLPTPWSETGIDGTFDVRVAADCVG